MTVPLTIPALFDSAVEACPDRVWLRYEDARWTYAEAADRVARAAAALAARGVAPGEPVLLPARNHPDHLFAWLAAVRNGAVVVAVNPDSAPAELAGLVAQTRPRVAVAEPAAADRLAGVETVLDVRELAHADPAGAPDVLVAPGDPAVLIATSGTTGRSKLVCQTHRAYAMAGAGFPYWMGLGSDDVLMTSLPLFHINAPAYSILGSVAARAGVALLPRFSASGFLDAARRHGATEFNAIGAMLEILMSQPVRPDDADTPLRRCYTGPTPPRARQLEIEARFGLEIVCGYALSESPYGLIWPRGTRPYGTLGAVRQHPELGVVNEARVVDEGREVAIGEVGELELRNPAVMLGYWGMPEATEEVLVDGWLRTGDLVRREPDGLYTFVARRKEVIRRRGENLAPAEVEAALSEHPEVAEVAVVGVPSALSEEEVKAFVVRRHGASVTPAVLHTFAAARLTRFKVPRYLELVHELPHTPTGRVAKHRLAPGLTGDEWDAETEVG